MKSWDRNAMRGYTYIFAGKGPQAMWRHHTGKAEGNECRCGIAQNAAHLIKYGLVGDWKGRSLAEAEKDMEWCAELYNFLHE